MMEWEESYTPLPYVFMALLLLWTVCVIVWTFNTWTKRRWQQVATGIFKHQNPHPPIFFLPFLLLLLHDISSSRNLFLFFFMKFSLLLLSSFFFLLQGFELDLGCFLCN
jgi:cbb3-type cytochrome oxidase subunit 3